MHTPQAQIKLNLPAPLKDYLASKASKFGMPIASYLRHLILKDIEDMNYPVYKASRKTEEAYKKAMEEKKTGKLISVDNIETFFKDL